MSHYVPVRYAVLNTKQVDLLCNATAIVGAVWGKGRSPHAGQVNGKTAVMALEPLDHATPQHVVSWHSVDEKNGIALTLVRTMHGFAPFSHRQTDGTCSIWTQGTG